MSYTWGIIRKDKNTVLMGSIWWGIAITLLTGLPIVTILKNNEQDIPIWLGIVFVLIFFPTVTFWLYKAGCRKLKKEK